MKLYFISMRKMISFLGWLGYVKFLHKCPFLMSRIVASLFRIYYIYRIYPVINLSLLPERSWQTYIGYISRHSFHNDSPKKRHIVIEIPMKAARGFLT